MPRNDWLILIGIGGLFTLLGIISIIWGRREEKSYYDALSDSTRPDVREFFERWPRRPEPGALKIGGWIAIAVGMLMLALGGGFWFWG